MRVSLRKVYTILFFIGVFFIPFNSFEGIKQFGEFKRESASIFFLLGSLFLSIEFFYTRKIRIPYRSFVFQLLLVLILWCFLTIILNFPVVYDSFYKRTSGVSRFIRQYFSLLLSCIVFFLLYFNVISKMSIKEVLLQIRSVFLYSFIVVSFYGFLEISHIVFRIYPARMVLNLFNYFPFTEYDSDINNRISSVCFEAPALAIFLITVSGWMFSYIVTHKGFIKYLPTIVVVILTYFSGSRTALIVVFLQGIIFFGIILSRKQVIKTVVYSAAAMAFFAVTVLVFSGDKVIKDVEKKVESLDFKGNLKNNISNQSRFGIQYANFVVFKNNPVVGVGYGQQGFHALHYYPIWAKKDNYEFKEIYMNKKNPMFAPGYNIYVRLLAETGIIGLLIFITFLYSTFSSTVKIIKTESGERKTLAIILLITFIGLAINWFQVDTFRTYGFWICFAILIKLKTTLNAEFYEK